MIRNIVVCISRPRGQIRAFCGVVGSIFVTECNKRHYTRDIPQGTHKSLWSWYEPGSCGVISSSAGHRTQYIIINSLWFRWFFKSLDSVYGVYSTYILTHTRANARTRKHTILWTWTRDDVTRSRQLVWFSTFYTGRGRSLEFSTVIRRSGAAERNNVFLIVLVFCVIVITNNNNIIILCGLSTV